MKKLIVLLALALPMLSMAQSIEGTWKFHPTYLMSAANDLVDTDHHVYALTNGTIIQVDKSTGTLQTLSAATGLNDVMAKGIYYNYDKHYLFITYANNNIDILHDDGTVDNVSALADVVMNVERTINDVTFGGDNVLIATNFGLVVLNDQTLQVTEFRQYGQSLTSAAMVGDRMVIAYGDTLYSSADRREVLSDFATMNVTQAAARLYPVNDTTFFAYGTNALKRCTVIDSLGHCNVVTIAAATPNNVQRTTDGWLANFRASSYYYTIASDSAFTATKVTGNNSSLYSCAPAGDGTVWMIDGNGIHIKDNTNYFKPDGMYLRSTSNNRLWYSLYNKWDDKFYVTSADQKNADLILNGNWVKYIYTFDGDNWTDNTPTALRSIARLGKIAFIPGMANSYFATDRSNNFYRVINGVLKGTFKSQSASSTLHYPSANSCLQALLVGHDGNLWMVGLMNSSGGAAKTVAVLPRDKVLADTVNVTDWVKLDMTPFNMTAPQRQSFVESTTGVKVYTTGQYEHPLNFWRQRAGATDLADVEAYNSKSFVDQTGKALNWVAREIHVMAADSTDNVWVGGEGGVFCFKASDAFNSDFRVTIPVVEDGNVSPYDMRVTGIGVDPLNRKWIGTYDSGLFVVSPDGSQVLSHFDTDNSDLPSSFIHDVSASLERAIVVTEAGVVEFDMNAIPVATDYTAVTASPTFVAPDYTGFVTIGLVDVGACVRITDRDGNTVRQFTATSSQVAWDTCDDSGERVVTGVYNVYAAPTADQLPGSPQARVSIIK